MKTIRLPVSLVALLLAAAALAPEASAGATVATTAKRAPATLPLTYAPPSSPGPEPVGLIIPLYGPGRTLLPEGRLTFWAGRSDGTPFAASTEVILRVPASGNLLLGNGTPVTELRLFTDADGFVFARFTTPDPNAGNGGGGGPAS